MIYLFNFLEVLNDWSPLTWRQSKTVSYAIRKAFRF